MSNRVGPVILSVDAAREHLQDHGEVFSFRTSDRTTGDTHYRRERNGGKVGDCHIEQVAPVYEWQVLWRAVDPFAQRSGFQFAARWIDAIERLHGEIPDTGYIYRITTEEASDE